jgi:hypothetical protein
MFPGRGSGTADHVSCVTAVPSSSAPRVTSLASHAFCEQIS